MKVLKYLAWTLIFVLSVARASGQVDPEKLSAELYRHDPDLKLYFAYSVGKLPTIVFFFNGGSAGGHLAACSAFCPDNDSPDDDFLTSLGFIKK